ncbi:hypothetical protein M3Y96_00794500 [Aphelenchoides besseyi]|nr:hypothetical protein M3Y96_00794500 [Aphelenchoides besseyi]
MKYRSLKLLALWSLFSIVKSSSEECDLNQNERSTFLWSVTSPNDDSQNFLFGTIHVAYDRVWDSVADSVKLILNRTDAMVFELALNDPLTINRLIRCKQLAAGETLRRTFSSDLYSRLSGYMSRLQKRLYAQLSANESSSNNNSSQLLKNRALRLLSLAQGWEIRRPVWLLFALYQLGENDDSMNSEKPMLDAFLAKQAQFQGKQLLSIETPKEQCNPLNSINKERLIFAINYTLSYLEWSENHKRRKSSVDELVKRYRCGSFAITEVSGWRVQDEGFTLNEQLDRQAKAFDNTLRSDVIDHRNVRMATRIHHLIRSNPKQMFVFALGAGQFNLIDLLRKYGYIIKAVRETDDITPYFLSHDIFRNFKQLWIRKKVPSNAHYELNPPISNQDRIHTPIPSIHSTNVVELSPFGNTTFRETSNTRVNVDKQ